MKALGDVNSLSSILLFLIVGSLAFGFGGLLLNSADSISKSDALVVFVLIILIGVTGVVGSFLLTPDDEYEYRVSSTDCSGIEDNVHEYDELSPEAQEAFDSALEADSSDPYTTGSSHEFAVDTDAGQRNCVEKNTQSYVMTIQKISPDSASETVFMWMSIIAVLLALISGPPLAFAYIYDYLW
jgi:hypothetical protein